MSHDLLTARWNETGEKIVQLADEFPGDRYEFTPAPGVRSFAEQLRHVAFWNQYVAATLHGESADGEANELPRDRFPGKAEIVPALRDSFGVVSDTLKGRNGEGDVTDLLVSFIGHNGEHYGQLAVYFRLNGLVPPASR